MIFTLLRAFKVRIVIRRYEAILFGSVMLLSGAVMPSSWEPSIHLLPPPHVTLPPKHPWIALTFDDGPHPGMTEKLLKVLEKEHVVGTFFVVGKMADRYPDIVRQISREGHEVESHSYTHPNMARISNETILKELDQTRSAIYRITGKDAYLFRPPGGDYSRRTVHVAAKAGYRMILWSVMTDDVEGASLRAIQRRIMDGADDGGIILMHSGVENTVEVLPSIIDQLRGRGYHFVTVSTLIGLTHPSLPTPARDIPSFQTASIPLPIKPVRTQ